jgi:hypothetical protein
MAAGRADPDFVEPDPSKRKKLHICCSIFICPTVHKLYQAGQFSWAEPCSQTSVNQQRRLHNTIPHPRLDWFSLTSFLWISTAV